MSHVDKFLGAPWREFFQFGDLLSRLKRMSFLERNVVEQREHNRRVSGADLEKHLGWFSFACMAWGTMVATGVFSLMPDVYATVAGPSVILSIIIACFASILSGLLFSELAVEYPFVGGAYVYVLNAFGELPAAICAANMVVAYIHGTSAVTRNFSYYFSVLIGEKKNVFQIDNHYDYIAAIVIAFLCLLAIFSTKVFNRVNIGLQITHVILVVIVIVAAFSKADSSNLHPFFNDTGKTGSGFRNMLTGASNVFFLILGFDIIALAAEEAKSPSSIPVGLISSISAVSITYILITIGMVLLYPAGELKAQYFDPPKSKVNIGGGFVYAFVRKNLKWAKYITALAAMVGIFSSAGLISFALSRIITVLAREGMIPAVGAYINSRTLTPVVAVACAGIITGSVSFFTSFKSLSRMTSIGTLTMYWFVSISYIYKRYASIENDDENSGSQHLLIPFRPDPFQTISNPDRRRPLALFYIFMITMCPVGFSIAFHESDHSTFLIISFVLWFVFTLLLQLTLPINYVPNDFALPWYLLPWVPSISIWMNVVLLGGFRSNASDYVKWLASMAIGVVVYILFGVHSSHWRFFGAEDLDDKGF